MRPALISLALLVSLSVTSAVQLSPRGREIPYRQDREQTIKGTIESTWPSERSNDEPLFGLTLASGTDRFNVLIGPESWVRKQSFHFEKGASIEVTGAAIWRVWDLPGMIAKRVKSGSQELVIRDESGKPKWQAR